jgi:hypothetical protein
MSINSDKQFQISSEPAMALLSFPLSFDFVRSPRHVFLTASKGGDQIPAYVQWMGQIARSKLRPK